MVCSAEFMVCSAAVCMLHSTELSCYLQVPTPLYLLCISVHLLQLDWT